MNLWQRGISAVWLTAAVLAASATGTWAQEAVPRPAGSASANVLNRSLSPPGGALIAPGTDPDVTLLYTGNVIGYVEPCG